MTQDEQYIADSIKKWVWTGYYGADDIQEMIDDILEDDCDEAMLRALVEPELQRKHDAESTWPARTECDLIDQVFYHLHEDGICALGNAGYTMSEGFTEVAEALHGAIEGHYHGYCFYHGQDIERAIEGHGLMIAFGSLDDDDANSLKVAQRVFDSLKAAGLEPQWDGSVKQRIDLPGFKWLRRS